MVCPVRQTLRPLVVVFGNVPIQPVHLECFDYVWMPGVSVRAWPNHSRASINFAFVNNYLSADNWTTFEAKEHASVHVGVTALTHCRWIRVHLIRVHLSVVRDGARVALHF